MSETAAIERPAVPAAMPGFADVSLPQLASASPAWLDRLGFGVIGLAADGKAVVYNAAEEAYAGLPRERVIGRPFFLAVGVCMNNYLVAQRFEDEPELDVVIDYVLTFRMRPTPVRLRLLQGSASPLHYILLQR